MILFLQGQELLLRNSRGFLELFLEVVDLLLSGDLLILSGDLVLQVRFAEPGDMVVVCGADLGVRVC